MASRRTDVFAALVAAAIFIAINIFGITWGLPSAAADPFLFGDRPPWTGQQIIALAGGWDDRGNLPADVAAHPIADASRPIVLNATDAQRAEIVRRYRLYSYQPDEMQTLRALASMHPGRFDFDPRFYQYGGLWVYPIGGLLRAAAALHRVTLRGDVAFYLDHPAAFGRMYVVMRLYSLAWGAPGAIAIYTIARLTGLRRVASLLAAAAFSAMPVVVNAAHEAKPHLAGVTLTLWAAVAAGRYARRATATRAALAGVICGGAASAVLLGAAAGLVLPIMTMGATGPARSRLRHALLAGVAMLGTYAVLNPYVLPHLFAGSPLVRSNAANTAAMYHAALSTGALANAVKLVAEGATTAVAAAGAVAAIAIFMSRRKLARPQTPEVLLLLAGPAVAIGAVFVTFAAGKPGEYGRFALLLDVTLLLTAFIGVNRLLRSRGPMIVANVVLLLAAAMGGSRYLRGFVEDASSRTTRVSAAKLLQFEMTQGNRVLKTNAEPAPYCLPPIDLWRWRVVLARDGRPTNGGVSIQTIDDPAAGDAASIFVIAPSQRRWPSQISWASKAFEVRTR